MPDQSDIERQKNGQEPILDQHKEALPLQSDNPVPDETPLTPGEMARVEAALNAEELNQPPLSLKNPTPTPSPAIGSGTDDMTSDYIGHRDQMEEDANIAAVDAAMGKGRETAGGKPPIGAPESPDQKKSIAKSIGMDIATGAGEFIPSVVGGVRDAAQANLDLIGEAATWVSDNLPEFLQPKFMSDAQAKDLLGADGFAAWKAKHPDSKTPNPAPKLPKGAEPKSVTGGLIHGVSQFLTGFIGPGGMAVKGIGATGKAAMVAKSMFQGAVADFTSFDPHQKRLSDLVQSFPTLRNPITAYLASDPNDSAAEGRLKNALEGLGLGIMAEGLIKVVNAVTSGRAADQVQRLAARMNGEKPPVGKVVTAEDLSILSQPTPSLVQEKVGTAVDATIAKNGTKEQFINFANINAPEDVKQVLKDQAKKGSKAIEEEARGVRTHAQTKLAADQENAWKVLMERRKGDPLNAEQSYAARTLWITSAEKLKETAVKASTSTKPSDIFAFRKMLAVHYAIQTEVLAARRETARALNQWKIPAGSSSDVYKQMESLIDSTGGATVAQDLAEKIAKLGQGGAYELEQFIAGGAPFARTRDVVSQLWINALLSNPATHAANSISNFASAAQQVFERKTAEYLSQRFGTEGGVALGEAMAMAHGGLEAFKDSMRASSKRIQNVKSAKDAGEKFIDFLRGTDESTMKWQGVDTGPAAQGGSLSSDRFAPEIAAASEKLGMSETSLGRALDVVDAATRTPGRLLGVADDFFKSIGYRMELNAQAVRKATAEFKGEQVSPEVFQQRVAEIVANPPSEIKLAAVDQATYQTFQGKPAEVLNKIGSSIQTMPVLGRLLLPFKKTPINIMTYTAERTPLAPLVQSWRAEVAAGGARRDVALARMATGTMVLSTMTDLAVSGQITGNGPTDPAEKQNWLRTHQPYSVKVGDKWVAYGRLDPIGFTLGIGADLGEAIVNAGREVSDHDFEQVMVGSMFAFSNNVMSKTYVRSITEFVAAVSQGAGKQEKLMQRIVGSMVPAGVAAITRNGIPGLINPDPYQRSVEDMVDALRRRIPTLSTGLAPARNLWGEKIPYQSGLGWAYDMFSPVYLKSATEQPIDKEMQNLRYFPDMPDKKLTAYETKVELNAHQYSRFVQLAGNELKYPGIGLGLRDFLNSVVTGQSPMSPGYKVAKEWDMKEGTTHAKEFLQEWINKYRDQARIQLMSESPELQMAFDDKNQRRTVKVPAKVLFQNR